MTWANPSLPHQIVPRFRAARTAEGWPGTMQIAVDCNCGAQLASRPRWDDPREPMRIWREHARSVQWDHS